MMHYIALLLTVLTTISGESFIEKRLSKRLYGGDQIIISGTGLRSRKGAIRLYDNQLTCGGRSGSVNDLVVILQSRIRKIRAGTKTSTTGCKDHYLPAKKAPEIAHGRNYTIIIAVTENGYHVKLGPSGERVIYKTTSGVGSVDRIIATSGQYSDIAVKRFVGRPVNQCGRRTILPSYIASRIAGGSDSQPGQYPWQVAIRKRRVFAWNPVAHMCGGTLIDNCWVLTAAHCTDQIKDHEANYLVRVGDYDNKEDSRSDEDQQDASIHQVFIHERFNHSGEAPVNDISLIKLKQTNGTCVVISNYVNPACLPVPDSDNFGPNTECEISGWGAESFHQSAVHYPTKLQKGKVYLRAFDRCKSLYGLDKRGQYFVQDGMTCAGGEADTCQGDSGGPLACQRDKTNLASPFVIWGITSWGEKCALETKPGVYTRVLDYIHWIHDVISRNSD